ncbi:MAG TPA: FtsX-like permease family protein [Thermosulfurimonas dismutans]|uniref:Cell division protein FtsX n=1 Tax=Thermosulfurimonas dismutans TaxID=999894 RepID=A0A7C3CK43_9BACT|nr:FtsX-like permease family protein [Thermosulfurimonas dismutans]
MFRRFWREFGLNRGAYLMTLFILAVAVSVLLFFSFFYYNLYSFSRRAARGLALTVYLEPGVSPQQRQAVRKALASLPGVVEIRLVKRSQVLAELRRIFRTNPDVLEEIDLSRLPSFFEVVFRDPLRDLERARARVPAIRKLPGVLEVQYARSWLGRIYNLSQLVKRLTFLSGIFLLVSLAFLMAVNIHLTLEKQREEIEVLYLLGATPGYIARPKVLAGFLVGLGAGLLACLLFGALKTYLDRALLGLWPFVDFQWEGLPWQFLILTVGGVGFFSALVSWFSVRRYFS